MSGVEHVEILVEEPSAEAFLREMLTRCRPRLSFAVFPFNGKPDLLAKLTARLRGYASWLPPDYRVFVLVDRDDDACHDLKQRLVTAADNAGLNALSTSDTPRQIVPRIVIEELEAWYFGEWEAVRNAYPRVPKTTSRRAKFRESDAIRGTWEAFEAILQRAGYFEGGLRKIEAARTIARHFDPGRCTSPSFRCFYDALAEPETSDSAS